jgi:hypothetical protein
MWCAYLDEEVVCLLAVLLCRQQGGGLPSGVGLSLQLDGPDGARRMRYWDQILEMARIQKILGKAPQRFGYNLGPHHIVKFGANMIYHRRGCCMCARQYLASNHRGDSSSKKKPRTRHNREGRDKMPNTPLQEKLPSHSPTDIHIRKGGSIMPMGPKIRRSIMWCARCDMYAINWLANMYFFSHIHNTIIINGVSNVIRTEGREC